MLQHTLLQPAYLRGVLLVWQRRKRCALPVKRQRDVASQTKENNPSWSDLPLEGIVEGLSPCDLGAGQRCRASL